VKILKRVTGGGSLLDVLWDIWAATGYRVCGGEDMIFPDRRSESRGLVSKVSSRRDDLMGSGFSDMLNMSRHQN